MKVFTFFACFIHEDYSEVVISVNQSVKHCHGDILYFLLLQLIQHPLDNLVVVPDVSLEDLRDAVLEVDQPRQVLYTVFLASSFIRYLDQVKITFVKLLINIYKYYVSISRQYLEIEQCHLSACHICRVKYQSGDDAI